MVLSHVIKASEIPAQFDEYIAIKTERKLANILTADQIQKKIFAMKK